MMPPSTIEMASPIFCGLDASSAAYVTDKPNDAPASAPVRILISATHQYASTNGTSTCITA